MMSSPGLMMSSLGQKVKNEDKSVMNNQSWTTVVKKRRGTNVIGQTLGQGLEASGLNQHVHTDQ